MLFTRKKSLKKICSYKAAAGEVFNTIQVLDLEGERIYFGLVGGTWFELTLELSRNNKLTMYNQRLPNRFVMLQKFLKSRNMQTMLEHHKGVWAPL